MLKPRPPSVLQTLVSIISLLLLLFMTVYYFGADSSSGPNQVALLWCAGIAALIGRYNGHQRTDIEQAIVRGISHTINAMLILLVVGALIGCWMLSGTVPMMIYAGLLLLHPEYFWGKSDTHEWKIKHGENQTPTDFPPALRLACA